MNITMCMQYIFKIKNPQKLKKLCTLKHSGFTALKTPKKNLVLCARPDEI